MRRCFAPSLAFTFEREGGFVNDVRDSGGATNMGITILTLSRWLKRGASVHDVQSLDKSVAAQIYCQWYWKPIAGDALPPSIDLMTFDMGVNSGCHEASKELQSVAGLTDDQLDGDIGPISLKAINARKNLWQFLNDLADAQEARYRSLAQFDTFGKGWLKRLDLRVKAARAIMAPPPKEKSP